MEELQSTEALDREILEDARKKAAKILKNAGEAAAASKAGWERRLEKTLAELRKTYAQKTEKARQEIMVRLPMDKRRVRSEKIEVFLAGAMADFLSALERQQMLCILERELLRRINDALPGSGKAFPEGPGSFRYRGLSAEEAAALAGRALPGLSLNCREDPLYDAPGVFPGIVIDFPRLRITASVDRAAESLLLDKRAELAEALLGAVEQDPAAEPLQTGGSGGKLLESAEGAGQEEPGPAGINGRVKRISGPIIKAGGMGRAGLFDVVEVGPRRLLGEIVRLENDEALIQVYEDDTGLQVGAAAVSEGRPLSVLLGPGLIGTIYDGVQRPLEVLYKKDGPFMHPGVKASPLDMEKKWPFAPDPALAEKLAAGEKPEAFPGQVLGTVRETESITCSIMVPPETSRGNHDRTGVFRPASAGTDRETITALVPAGEYDCTEVIAQTSTGREIRLAQWWPVRIPRPAAERLSPEEPLVTGERVIDLFFPLSKGGAAAIPGGFGTGKTMTQHAIAKWCDADVIVYIGCGERGNEMTDVLTEFPHLEDPRTGRSLMERTILIANTSNMPVAAREVSIYTGVTLAEFYRDMGLHVAIMADSTSRWAEALRELSGRMEEMPAEEGFPAYLPTRLAEFYERAGRVHTLGGREGSVSIIGAVSPPGGDFSEPVTQHTKRFIRCFWALDRDLANARHYPAISWIDSYSEYAEEVRSWWEKLSPRWAAVRQEALDLLKKEQRLEEIVRLIGPDALPDGERLVLLASEIIKDGFLQQNSFDELDRYCVPAKQIRLLELIMEFYRRSHTCIHLGAPLYKISALAAEEGGRPLREGLSRLKSEIKNGDESAFASFEKDMAGALEVLERSYRSKELL